jgi:hypothetical protein
MQFSTKRTYGGLKDQDRIFTNLYKDGDPFIEGALKRVLYLYYLNLLVFRVTGIKQRMSSLTAPTGLLMRLRSRVFAGEAVRVSQVASSTPSCPRFQMAVPLTS